jgi:predicted lipid-binding transport protein (Tim44 family)
MRRVLTLLLLLALTLPATALAGAGGGTSGFGGGGGGGGGFSGGGGGFSGGGGTGTSGGFSFIGFAIIVVIVLGAAIVSWIKRESIARAYRRRRAQRAERVHAAAAEASEDDAWFAADAVTADAEKLFRDIQAAWDARDEAALGRMVGPDLHTEWTRRLKAFARKGWHNRVQVEGLVQVEYLGLVNREDDSQDRVCVRITATLHDFVVDRHNAKIVRTDAGTSEFKTTSEWWILARDGDGWRLVSIEQDAEGHHLLDDAIVASPWSDDGALHDEAVVENAQADAVPEGVKIAEVADLDFDGDARTAALDLSLADGRFAPDVLEVAVRRAAAGWAEAVDGDDAPLEAVATPEAVRALLHPDGEGTRLVVRGPRIERLAILALDAAAEPPAMTVELSLTGRRYVENRDTLDKLSGSADRETRWTETWVLGLDGDAANPWRLRRAGAPVG